MRVSRDIVRKYNGRNQDRVLATAIHIKSYYKNSTIYDYKSKNVHLRLGIAKASFDKYVSILLSNKDAVVMNGNLTICRLCDRFGTKGVQWVRVDNKKINNNLNDSIIYVNSLLFRLEASKQEYLISLKERSSKGMNPRTKAELDSSKGANKILAGMGIEWDSKNQKYSIHKEVNFSIEGISDRLNISYYKTYKMIHHLKSKGLLFVIHNMIPKRYLGKRSKATKTSDVSFVSKNGNEFICLPNSYRFHSSYTL